MQRPSRSKLVYLRPWKKKSTVALSGETGVRADGDACNQTEVEAQQFEEIDNQHDFFTIRTVNCASDWTWEDDDMIDFVTANPCNYRGRRSCLVDIFS